MPIHHYPLGPLNNNTYLIIDSVTGVAAIIDPSFDSEAIWPDVQARRLGMRYVLNTHGHFDHLVGNRFFVDRTGASVALHAADLELLRALPEQGRAFGFDLEPSPEPSLLLFDGQTISLGHTSICVRHTPGHSPGSVTFVLEDAAIVGDCLFAGGIGRTDLPGASAETLIGSIRTRILTLPDATRVLPGHGALTTIGAEKETNPYLQAT